MSQDRAKNLDQNKPGLFSPSVIRSIINDSAASNEFKTTAGEVVNNTNIDNKDSFKYALPGDGLKSTQQLNIDWSNFENHTFFNSAQVKTNVAFDKIINEYPFDGTKKEAENYFDKLTGFERWVYDRFPKYKGYLFFSGTNPAESSGGTYVTTKDFSGAAYPTISKITTGKTILNPGINPLSIEFYLYLPTQANSASVILDKHTESGANKHGFYVGLAENSTVSASQVSFYVLSGTVNEQLSVEVTKGEWQHFAFVWDRTPGVYKTFAYKNGELVNSSSYGIEFGEISASTADLLIGSGSAITGIFTPLTTLSGALDELRIWHSLRSKEQINQNMQKAIFAESDLKLYYRFNEPADINSALVIDYSSNSLHGTLSTSGRNLGVREVSTGSIAGETPMSYEKLDFSPVLFPSYSEVNDLRLELLISGSAYDDDNPNLITKLIPPHYLVEGQVESGLETEQGEILTSLQGGTDPRTVKLGATQTLLLLLYTWAKFFDEMKLFIQAFSDLNFVDYNQTDTVPDQFLLQYAKSQGIDLPPLFTGASVEQFLEAENIQNDISTNEQSLQYVQNQIWRRILINLKDIIRSKGTIHSVKSFIRSVGIDPDNNFRIREYGGPTRRSLSFVRDKRYEVSTMLDFTNGGRIYSPYLAAFKSEPGWPYDSVEPGRYNGALTSGSFTYEGIYKFDNIINQASQSLVRFQVTGSSISGSGVALNLVAVSGANKITLHTRPGYNSSSLGLSLSLTGVDIFDGDKWYVSCGRQRSDDNLDSDISASYFIRAAKANYGDILEQHLTSSFFNEFESVSGSSAPIWGYRTSSVSPSGSYFTIGSQSLGEPLDYFNNNTASMPEESRITFFEGYVSQIRFWSKFLKENEWQEHVRNYRSVGVADPSINFNFTTTASGSWERLRLDASTDQLTTSSNSSGEIEIFDFTQNEFHLSGVLFPTSSVVIQPERFYFSYISPKFDEASTVEKVRIRSFTEYDNVLQYPWAQVAPAYEIVRSELPTDNTRFTIDFSIVDTLDQDIITIFSSLDYLDNALGNPELMFSPDYPELSKLREVYFNKLTDKVNIKNFFEFFKWFDTNIGTFVSQLIPRKTKFLGTNFVVQSHMLERPKIEYLFNEIYLGESNRVGLNSRILLQLFAGNVVRY